jgi:putative ABC transport system ATP-binding protein
MPTGPGDLLFREGDDGDLVHGVEHGRIELSRERADAAPEIVARITDGQYFGELAPMFGLRRSATARAVGSTTVRGCSPTEFRASMGRDAVNELIGAHSPVG